MVADTCDRLGCDYRVYECASESNLFKIRKEEAHKAIKRSINKKTPVIAWDVLMPEFGIIRGYDDKKKVYFVSSPMDIREEFTMPFSKLGNGAVRHLYVLILGEKVKSSWWEKSMRL